MKNLSSITKLANKFEAKIAQDRFSTDPVPAGAGSRGLSDSEIQELRDALDPRMLAATQIAKELARYAENGEQPPSYLIDAAHNL